ncbi:hypothetical protein BGP78_03015 [Pseudoalteromonas sp. MSK9-3]|uniref:hypothetical protein n=1 Tax=Pseudoalteromonas sp. MSK9-3 TaxID=1897633 RepID=UPI000E6B6D90|nr:hypothetical protein [Pseudoalteromonas sp. MSK9-3]RJE75707.1 hypothetical protein BGP78_03015 [Pseudoalteromonas sp. MSK9-3]
MAKLNLILPTLFSGSGAGPGHKKDLINIYKVFLSLNYTVNLHYVDTLDRKLAKLQLKKIFNNRDSEYFLLGPLYLFRGYLGYIPKNTYIYVADSPLKTSISDFLKTGKNLHRVIYNYYIERRMRYFKLILASQEECAWYSSSGYDINKLNLLLPSPDFDSFDIRINQSQVFKKNQVFLYNPNGSGVKIAIKVLESLFQLRASSEDSVEVIVSGKYSNEIALAFNGKKFCKSKVDIKAVGFIDNIELIIRESMLVLLTDVGGSGLCNRSIQVRQLGVRLVCTIDSIRGTNLLYDNGVIASNSTYDIANEVNNICKLYKEHSGKLESSYSKSVELHCSSFKEQLDNLIVSIFGSNNV